jgi:hypothetical protein
MQRNRIGLAVLGSLLAGGLAVARSARGADSINVGAPRDDFTFSVPVDLHAITGTTGGHVYCNALSVVPPAAPAAPGGEAVAMGGTEFTLTSGAFQGTLTVHAGLRPGKKVEDARGYQCYLWFRTANGQEKAASAFSHKQGTPYSDDIRGPINP